MDDFTQNPLSNQLSPEKLAKALGEAPKDPFLTQVVSDYDPQVIKEILEKVMKVPAGQIKKSRVALFRYLINKQTKT